MSDRICAYPRREEVLVGFLYDDLDQAERQAFAAHVVACPVCRTELDDLQGIRGDLARWTPPDSARVLAFTPPRGRVASALADVPAWARAAAAMLALGVATGAAAGLANLEVRVEGDGFTVRTGWTRVPAEEVRSADPAPDNAPWRADLTALENTLRAELQNVSAPSSQRASGSDEALLRQVRAMIAASESNQRRELALGVAAVARDVQVQRAADLQRIQRSFTALDRTTGGEISRQRVMLNNIAQLVSQQQ
jgi:hypothetical protein